MEETKEFKKGDLIKPTKESGFVLRSGASHYDKAIVISVEPFIITSEGFDMRLEATIKKEYFELADVSVFIEKSPEDILNKYSAGKDVYIGAHHQEYVLKSDAINAIREYGNQCKSKMIHQMKTLSKQIDNE